MVFCNTTKSCDWTSYFLEEQGIPQIRLNGNMPKKVGTRGTQGSPQTCHKSTMWGGRARERERSAQQKGLERTLESLGSPKHMIELRCVTLKVIKVCLINCRNGDCILNVLKRNKLLFLFVQMSLQEDWTPLM